MEQLGLKTEGEKKISLQKVCRGVLELCSSRDLVIHPHSPRVGPQHKAQRPSSAAAGVQERTAWWSQCGHSCLMAPSEHKDFVLRVLFSSVGTIFHLTGT